MDPDAALETIRTATLASRQSEWIPGEDVGHDSLIEDAMDAMEALDTWLTKGGFLPSAWTPSKSR